MADAMQTYRDEMQDIMADPHSGITGVSIEAVETGTEAHIGPR